MLLNATLEEPLEPHMPLVTEIIGATPRPSSCTPLIPQPKPGSTSAWRFLRFPPSYPDSREYENAVKLTRDTLNRSGRSTASVLSTTSTPELAFT